MNPMISGWLNKVPDTPLFEVWFASLMLILALAMAFMIWPTFRLMRDQFDLWRCRKRPQDTAAIPSGGVVGRWAAVLRVRAEKHLSIDQETLEQVLGGRYDMALHVVAFLRGSATMVGLLFTFLGLAFALFELSSQLGQVGNELAPSLSEFEQVLSNVKAAMPNLSMAFASSICGLLIALFVGVLSSLLEAGRMSVGSQLSALSAEWLEPLLAPPSGGNELLFYLREQTRAIQGAMEAQREAIEQSMGKQREAIAAGFTDLTKELSTQGERQVLMHGQLGRSLDVVTKTSTDVKETNDELSTRLVSLSSAVSSLAGDWGNQGGVLLDRLEKIGNQQTVSFGETMTSTQSAWEAMLAKAGTELEGSFGRMVQTADEGMKKLTEAIDHVRADGVVYIQDLQQLMTALTQNAAEFGRLTHRVSEDLDVSSENIRSLREAGEDFRVTLNATQDIVNESEQRIRDVVTAMKTSLDQIPILTEAVSEAAKASGRASINLERVIASEHMEHYLANLPRLIELSESEIKTRESLGKAVGSFVEIAGSLDKLDDLVIRIAATGEGMARSQEEISASLESLAVQNLSPAIAAVVRSSALEVTQQAEQSWAGRHQALQDSLGGSVERLQADMGMFVQQHRRLLEWYERPAWQRVLGRHEQ
jgi:hypothetical protein